MNRFSQEELAELFLRCIHLARFSEQQLHLVPMDIDAYNKAATSEAQAPREFWNALYSLRIEEREQSERHVIKVTPDRDDTR